MQKKIKKITTYSLQKRKIRKHISYYIDIYTYIKINTNIDL